MNRLKASIGILLIFVLGALAGSLGTGFYLKHRIGEFARGGPPPLMHLLMRRMSHELNLTEAQKIEIERIVEQAHKKISDFRERYHPEFEKIIDNSFALIKEKLNEEQKIKMDELHKELKKRRGRRGPPGIFQPHRLHKTPEHLFATMKKRLKLTKEQEEMVRPIIDEGIEKKQSVIKEYREQCRQGLHSLERDMQALEKTIEKQLDPVLTEEQKKEYQKIQEDQRQKMRSKTRQCTSGRFNQFLN